MNYVGGLDFKYVLASTNDSGAVREEWEYLLLCVAARVKKLTRYLSKGCTLR